LARVFVFEILEGKDYEGLTLRLYHCDVAAEAAGEATKTTIGSWPDLPLLAAVTRRLVVVRFHIPFWQRSSGGKRKAISPVEKMATIANDGSRISPLA